MTATRSHILNELRRQPTAPIIVILLGILAAQPLITGQLPQGDDTLYHLYRLGQVDALIRQGIFFSRWAPDLAYGYGYPLFNYYAPLVYYVTEPLCILGLSPVAATRLIYTFMFVLAGLSMYAWVKDIFNQRAGVISAAAYVLSPYFLANAFWRGSFAEQLALSLLPAILCVTHRFAQTATIRRGLLLTVLYATLILAHNVSALVFSPLLVVYIIVTSGLYCHGPLRWRQGFSSAAKYFAFLALGVLITTFFWLPAITEQKLVSIEQLYIPPGFDYHENFMTLSKIFAFPESVDPNLVIQRFWPSLSIVCLLLSIVGFPLLLLAKQQLPQKIHSLFAAIASASYVFLVLPTSTPIWDSLTPLRLLQFPWRMLSVASLLLAFLCAGGEYFIDQFLSPRRNLCTLFITALMGIMILYGFSRQIILKTIPDNFDLSTSSIIKHNTTTTTFGEYTPIGVKQQPQPADSAYQHNGERLDRSSLPTGTRLISEQNSPLSYDLWVESPISFTAIFRTFYFAGWQAYVDGIITPTTPSNPYGLISVPVQAGRRHIVVSFSSTPVRNTADIASGIGILLAGTLIFIFLKKSSRQLFSTQSPLQSLYRCDSITFTEGSFLAILLILGFSIKAIYIDKHDTLYRYSHFNGSSIVGIDHPANTNFGNQLILMGADNPTDVGMGSTIDVVLYWRAINKLDKEYSTSVQLVDTLGFVVGQADNQHPDNWPTTLWDVQGYARDTHHLAIYPGTPPGQYMLRVIVYPYGQPDKNVPILDSTGSIISTSFNAGMITITRGNLSIDPTAIRPQTHVNTVMGNGISLIGFDWTTHSAQTGDQVPLTLYWQVLETPSRDFSAYVTFITSSTEDSKASVDIPLVSNYATSLWRSGDIWRAAHKLVIPAQLSTGQYTMAIQLENGATSTTLGTLTITAPSHIMNPPIITQSQTAQFSNIAELIGYDVSPHIQPGNTMTLTLIWKALEPTATSYKVFVHLLDANGRLIASDDRVPAMWQRPTTSWVTGEYIVDLHELQIAPNTPAQSANIEIGLYDEIGQQRLLLTNGANGLLLHQPISISQ